MQGGVGVGAELGVRHVGYTSFGVVAGDAPEIAGQLMLAEIQLRSARAQLEAIGRRGDGRASLEQCAGDGVCVRRHGPRGELDERRERYLDERLRRIVVQRDRPRCQQIGSARRPRSLVEDGERRSCRSREGVHRETSHVIGRHPLHGVARAGWIVVADVVPGEAHRSLERAEERPCAKAREAAGRTHRHVHPVPVHLCTSRSRCRTAHQAARDDRGIAAVAACGGAHRASRTRHACGRMSTPTWLR